MLSELSEGRMNMGWSYGMATEYRNGRVNRKAEMDKLFNWESDLKKVSVVKSTMVGSVYYAAIKVTTQEEEKVTAAVCLTRVTEGEFGYKGMDESMGPYYYECPGTILKELKPTDNENAINWRKKCVEYTKAKSRLAKLPVGTEIEFEVNGNKVRLVKSPAAYQFRKPFWEVVGSYNRYYRKTDIPVLGYKVV